LGDYESGGNCAAVMGKGGDQGRRVGVERSRVLSDRIGFKKLQRLPRRHWPCRTDIGHSKISLARFPIDLSLLFACAILEHIDTSHIVFRAPSVGSHVSMIKRYQSIKLPIYLKGLQPKQLKDHRTLDKFKGELDMELAV